MLTVSREIRRVMRRGILFSLWNNTLPSTTVLPFEFLSGCRFLGK
jgi:hypothetical protein